MLGVSTLVGEAALRAGAGKVQPTAIPTHVIPLGMALPEARIVEASERRGEIAARISSRLSQAVEDCDAIVVGPGMIDSDNAGVLALELLTKARGRPLVVDAAALTGVFARVGTIDVSSVAWIVTPHAGEMASCLGVDKQVVLDDPVSAARRAAATLNAVVVLKAPPLIWSRRKARSTSTRRG
jgi:ADP-dependent NAD(P)H-hydrate dehydratase